MKHYVGKVFVAKTEAILLGPSMEYVEVQKGHLLLVYKAKWEKGYHEFCFLDLVHGEKLHYASLTRESVISWLENRMEVLV